MITLITGNTGEGKTALVVQMLSEIKDRPIFVMGIRDLKIPHQMVPPLAEWTRLEPTLEDSSILQPVYAFPPNSLLVIDEAQNVFRPRAATSKIPDHVAALETHRHTGIDVWLITQHPSFLDTTCRRLTRKHTHIRSSVLGRYKYEWNEVGDPDSKISRDLASKERYKPAKEVFGLYKSAEAHTALKVKKPWFFWASIVLIPVLLGFIYKVYTRIQGNFSPEKNQVIELSEKSSVRSSTGDIKNPEQYTQQYVPRELGVMHTAPAYDELTKPQSVPVVVGCINVEKTDCKCFTQQGSIYETTVQMCEQWIAQGLPFMPWKADPVKTIDAKHDASPFGLSSHHEAANGA
ncbi:MAG: zonular occludens toxin domain-containing protein [Rugosibacter sp.]|nr:zonular occludens toxin domain-containing protein [Rugosibacter sp.]